MRDTRTNDGLKVHVIAGTYAVMFGFDRPQADCDNLLGFSTHRTDHDESNACRNGAALFRLTLVEKETRSMKTGSANDAEALINPPSDASTRRKHFARSQQGEYL